MAKPVVKRIRVKAIQEGAPSKRQQAVVKRSSVKMVDKPSALPLKHRLLILGFELLGLGIIAIYAIMVLLGYSANWLSGSNLISNLLPFAMTVLLLVIAVTTVLIGWWRLRKWLSVKAPRLTPMVPVCLILLIAWFGTHTSLTHAVGDFRTLVGGKHEASRVTLSHQVYAAYRRYDMSQLRKMVDRSQAFNSAILQAAKAFNLDVNLLQGIAATESSFMPRDSFDGGHGLFQITLVPRHIMASAAKRLKVSKVSLNDPRHNAYVAAATLSHYLQEMKNDLFLGLLAYNIGPANGGLRFIMKQYGATDFITIQPYLQQLPRDYPIRVLSYALAFRLWQQEGRLLAYEEGKNAIHIQTIGIPGLHKEF